jgi:large repetitive protein
MPARRAVISFLFVMASVNAWGALTITTASPLPDGTVGTAYSQVLTATGGTPPYTWTATGVPAGLTLSSSGTLSGTPTASGTQAIAVTATDSSVLTAPNTGSASLSLTIAPPPTFMLTGLPATAGQQALFTAAISSPFSLPLSGTLTLTFAPAEGVDDPNIEFVQNGASTGSRQVSFTIAAGSTTAVFTGGTTRLATGTVTGTITITPSALTYDGGSIPAAAPSTITIKPTPPVITKLIITDVASSSNSPGGFNIAVSGYSTPRDMVSAQFQFTPTTGTNLATTGVTVSVGTPFLNWYNSSASDAFGSEFTLTVPFTFQVSSGPISIAPVAALTVTLTNSIGTSNPVAGNP